MPTLATPAVEHNNPSSPTRVSWHPAVADGAHKSLPCWRGAKHWLTAVKVCLGSSEGVAVLKATRITAATVLLVAAADAGVANHRTGRGVATAHETVAGLARVSIATVRRARRVLEELGLAATVLPGRYMTTVERQEARAHHGGYQVRFASVRALVLPRRLAAVQNEHLPRRGLETPISPKKMGTNTRYRARRGRSAASRGREGQHQRTLPLQRLAGRLAARVPWVARGRHIGALCDVLTAEGVDPQGWTANDLLAAIDRHYADRDWITPAASSQRNPLGLLRTQIRAAIASVEPPQLRRRGEAEARAVARQRRLVDADQARVEAAPPERVRAYAAQMRKQLQERQRLSKYVTT